MPVHRYSRPAHAALAEFAPRNTFFAHKSKVEIDQIDMSVEPPAEHRFCASCHFLTPLTEPEAKSDTCPHCGDSHWADGSQVRPALRLTARRRQYQARGQDADHRDRRGPQSPVLCPPAADELRYRGRAQRLDAGVRPGHLRFRVHRQGDLSRPQSRPAGTR